MRNLKIKKLISWWIDFFIYFFCVMRFLMLVSPIILKLSTFVFALLVIVIIYISYSKKDILFKGRSLGKRIFSLAVYNEEGTELVDNKVLRKRGNIEMFTFPLDFWFILFLDKQIADYVCKTDVKDYKREG